MNTQNRIRAAKRFLATGIGSRKSKPLAMGQRLGEGAYKKAYVIAGSRNSLVALICTYVDEFQTLRDQIRDIRALASKRVPVIKEFGLRWVVDPETEEVCRAHVVLRMDASNRASDENRDVEYDNNIIHFYKRMNARSLSNLQRIRAAMAKNLDIVDLQFLIDDDGNLVVADPGGVLTPKHIDWDSGDHEYHLALVDELLALNRKRLRTKRLPRHVSLDIA